MGDGEPDDTRPDPWAPAGRYDLACSVHGEVLVGDEVLVVDAPGGRAHRWGSDPWGAPWQRWARIPGDTHAGAEPAGPGGPGSPALSVRLAVPGAGIVTAQVARPTAGPARWHARYDPAR